MAGDYLTDWHETQAKWDQAQKDGIFAASRKPYNPEPTQIEDYRVDGFDPGDFGMSREMAALAANSENMSDAEYWAAVAGVARADAPRKRVAEPEPRVEESPGILHEAGSIATPNPVDASTLGQDSAPVVTPGWAGGEALVRLERMKLELYELGSKLASAGVPKGWDPDATPVSSEVKPGQDVMKKIAALWHQVDELSNSLSPGTIEKDCLS